MPDARLQVSDPDGRRLVTLDKPLFLIGRRTSADLQVISTDVSREHAEIACDGERYLLRDRGSRYGTYVNGRQVTEHTLGHGDKIRLGRGESVELVFLVEDASSSLRPASTDLSDFRQMAAILNGLRALGSGRVLDEVLTLVMDSALEVTKADRGFVMLANASGALEFKIARGKGQVTLPPGSFTTSEKIPREVFATGRSRIVGDLLDGDLAGKHDGTIAVGIRHILCVPLLVAHGASDDEDGRQHVIGVLYLDGRERHTMLSQATLSSLEAFATQAALGIESARLYAEAAEKARLERDLRIAAEIQRALLPASTFEGPNCDLAAASIPCRTVGGDFFDYLDGTGVELAFALGDVAGKGPPAALLAAAVQSNFVALAPVSRDPAETMARVNKALLRRAIEARFATMCYCMVSDRGELSYCNAGQEPPLVIGASGDLRWLEAGGPVLGLLDSATYECETISLARGDLVIVCSDGVTEARNVANEEFGRDRLVAAVQECHGSKPEAVLETLLAAVKTFSVGAAQADDITALVVRYHGGRLASR